MRETHDVGLNQPDEPEPASDVIESADAEPASSADDANSSGDDADSEPEEDADDDIGPSPLARL